MRYRRDVPAGVDLAEVARHVVAHLAGATHPDDDPGPYSHDVAVTVGYHDERPSELVTVVGEIDGEPDASYLREGYDPAADHAEITFTPFENPASGQLADYDALRRFRESR